MSSWEAGSRSGRLPARGSRSCLPGRSPWARCRRRPVLPSSLCTRPGPGAHARLLLQGARRLCRAAARVRAQPDGRGPDAGAVEGDQWRHEREPALPLFRHGLPGECSTSALLQLQPDWGLRPPRSWPAEARPPSAPPLPPPCSACCPHTTEQGFASGDCDRDAQSIRIFLEDGHRMALSQARTNSLPPLPAAGCSSAGARQPAYPPPPVPDPE